jgi:predicted glutamine amidotransferase
MCIICYHEQGKELPSEEHMKNSWDNNPDGAGFAVWREDENRWEVEKGFMFKEDFNARYKEMNFTEDDLFILHWRIATSGKTDAERTHPFPITDNCDNMTALKYKRKKIVFHNGVVGAGTENHSDTMIAIRDWVVPLWKYMHDDKIYYLLEDLWSPSRVLICDGDMIAELGDWETDEETGILWSNDGYLENKWDKWKRTAKERYTSGTVYSHTTSVTGDWSSPFRDNDGDFDWSKFHKQEVAEDRQSTWDDWEVADDPADDVGPNEDACAWDEAVVAMVDAQENVHMDASYDSEAIVKEYIMCPHCTEDKYLQDTPFNMGDTICLVCGCVFVDATGEQVYFDPDIKANWKETKEAVNG